MSPQSLPFTDRAWSRPDPPARSATGGFPRRMLLAAAGAGAVGLLGSCSKTGEPFVFEYDIVELHRGTDDLHWTAIVIASADASLRAQARVSVDHLEVVVTNDPPVTVTPPKGNWGGHRAHGSQNRVRGHAESESGRAQLRDQVRPADPGRVVPAPKFLLEDYITAAP